jgi:hypothetical protein
MGKAVEGRRTPKRKAFTSDLRIAQSVLDCTSPLALSKGTGRFVISDRAAMTNDLIRPATTYS